MITTIKSKLLNLAVIIFVIATLCISGCGDTTESGSFLNDKDPQQMSERIIKNTLIPADSLVISEVFDVLNASRIDVDENHLYLGSPRNEEGISIINKQSLDYLFTISPDEGRGPGEVTGIGATDIASSHIAISNENLFKVQVWSKTGEFITEFLLDEIRPHRVSLWENGEITILAPMSANVDHVFHTIDGQGNLLFSFGETPEDNYNPLMYSGRTATDEEHFYYAGFSEHVLQKWDREGNRIFSRSTIDDYPSEANYVRFESGEQRISQYSEMGYFSAIGLFIYNGYIIIMHGGDRNDPGYQQFLDVYEKSGGEYQFSLELPHNASSGSFAVDDEYIYVMHNNEDGESFLARYPNTEI